MLRTVTLVALLAGRTIQVTTPYSVVNNINNGELDPLRFNADGNFKICVFSDLHFAEDPSSVGPEKDTRSARVMADVLDAELPDLVVLNRDLISGESTYRENSTHYVNQIVAPMVDRNLTWASTYGNHDHNRNIDGKEILEREQSWTGARTNAMVSAPDAGTTNYYLPVYASDCNRNCTPELILWFFDSRGGFYYQSRAQPNWVDTSVTVWFNRTNADFVEQYSKEIPSLVFVHIPLYASLILQQDTGIDKNHQPGINDEKVIQQGQGWCAEDDDSGNCNYGDQDLPSMRALLSKSGVIGLFSGHDHANSWCYKWDSKVGDMQVTGNGIKLCYGQHTGYGGYGNWIRGGRQIIVTQERLKYHEVDTHIRLETGGVVGRVTLNSTYNEDFYEATPNQKTYLNNASGSDSESQSFIYKGKRRIFRSPFAVAVAVIVWSML
ncbi:Metallo-dependent phosphatase-like protein [Fusarium flagelliforme]|uniref:Calcineurin-like phosphoesterase domain-containing protein n=1 Tax=Fusarium flagelliforme TaxID=2675880 RepID=A0A395M7N7_9HYPO|nr:Metallo-dependent phosphatase-like protein [Fusarium flagelliforme]KAH7169661.1 Metallo-dependent phosphatase-like protein [Fusarium flagelliforme]RFN43874.1 hypothetical protein FIE12Z_11887 [Fusarium flagelliforme]